MEKAIQFKDNKVNFSLDISGTSDGHILQTKEQIKSFDILEKIELKKIGKTIENTNKTIQKTAAIIEKVFVNIHFLFNW